LNKKTKTILDRWQITAEELTDIVEANPSMRGNMFGYVAEMKLRKMWFSDERVTYAVKYDDHNRKKKGDLVITYRGYSFIVESKSLQTNSIKRVGDKLVATSQCDASDKRAIMLPDGSSLTTTNLLTGEFDLLAINIFAFHERWEFLFAKNRDLPRSKHRGYTPEQRTHLLATSVPVTYPPEPPLYAEPYVLLDEIIEERKRGNVEKPLVVEGGDEDDKIILT
jgi:hypothetical protein